MKSKLWKLAMSLKTESTDGGAILIGLLLIAEGLYNMGPEIYGGRYNIVYETQDYFVLRTDKGFEVYKHGPTVATRVSQIGYQGQKGLDRAKLEIERRTAKEHRP